MVGTSHPKHLDSNQPKNINGSRLLLIAFPLFQ